MFYSCIFFYFGLHFLEINVFVLVRYDADANIIRFLFQYVLDVMGARVWLQWIAYFVQYMVLIMFTITVLIVLLHWPVRLNHVAVDGGLVGSQSYHHSIINNTQTSVLFAFLFVYSLAAVCFGFAAGSLFSIGKCMLQQLASFFVCCSFFIYSARTFFIMNRRGKTRTFFINQINFRIRGYQPHA